MVAEPGLVVVDSGTGEIMMPPVSVCHQVSTMGQQPPPMCLWYQIQASGLIGSPTVPRSRSDERSCCSANCGPYFIWARIAVGRHVDDSHLVAFDDVPPAAPGSGQSGVPSYMTPVVLFASGP